MLGRRGWTVCMSAWNKRTEGDMHMCMRAGTLMGPRKAARTWVGVILADVRYPAASELASNSMAADEHAWEQ